MENESRIEQLTQRIVRKSTKTKQHLKELEFNQMERRKKLTIFKSKKLSTKRIKLRSIENNTKTEKEVHDFNTNAKKIDNLIGDIEEMIKQAEEDLEEMEYDQMEIQMELINVRYNDEVLAQENRDIQKNIQELDREIFDFEERNIDLKSMRKILSVVYEVY